ncbi:acyl carrier protein [Vicingaceae bacterium]|nr:acyl carrier protein [Vicingaceae bacterium]
MKLYNIISETFGVNVSEITDDTRFLSLEDWDSMSHMMFITNLEDSYSIDFEGDDIVDVSSVGELKELLRMYHVEKL